ncbi:MAG: AmmeMemoRadiSam system protein B [Candidatus Magasanikbacteria bacterium]|nr:AmmeMemoRadiSam system protein B [Candidatus Magasanikbacteria bacterium]
MIAPRAVLPIAIGVAAGIAWLNFSFSAAGNPLVKVDFFLPEPFYQGEAAAPTLSENQPIVAALVPHHLIAGTELATIFKLLRAKGYRRAFIIGPNHYNAGPANILTATVDGETPFGVQPGRRWIKYPELETRLIANEHSVMGMLPYVKHYLSAETQPFILKAKTSRAELESLAARLAEAADDKTIFIFSVDFSHYLPKAVAQKNDELTARALLALDEELVAPLNNDYTDSPASLILMFKICKQQGAWFKIIDHANSADLIGQPRLAQTTSYFTGYCAR